MNPLSFALRHPITVLVGLLALVGASGLAWQRMKVDIFPELNLPVIYVCQPYGGMDPAQMEGLLTNYYEYHFLYIAGIHHVESKNIQGVALMKLFFHPGTDMSQAMAETINYVNRSRAFMPPNTVSPFAMRFDTGSVPVGYLVLDTKNPNYTIGEMQRRALFDVRPIFASLPGVSAPPPFGGSQRTIVLKVDPKKLDAQGASLQQVISALQSGNTVSPSGNMIDIDQYPIVRLNAVATNIQELGNIPLTPGSKVCLRDIGEVRDTTDIPTGFAVVNGQRTVYLLVTKRADASTLAVVNAVKTALPRMKHALPDDIDIRLEFDQSPYVTRAMAGVATEGLLGAFLTGLMVLLFLRDSRSVLVVVLNIPLALLAALLGLWLSGQTLNLMTLGGLALAVGILVDEATVEVENIHTQLTQTDSIARAVRLGNAETAVPRLLALLCILAVLLPSFFMQGAARSLFVPLALAVGFAMLASYVLSSTLVPVLSVWLLRKQSVTHQQTGFFTRWQTIYTAWLQKLLPRRRLMTGLYAALLAGLALWWWRGHAGLGTEIFPTVDAGQFQLRLRAPTGTRIQRTEELTLQTIGFIKQTVGPENVALTLSYIGVIPPSYPINNVYLWTSGPEEAVLRVALKPGSGWQVTTLKEKIRAELPEYLREFLRARLAGDGLSTEAAQERVQGLRVSFEPADVVNEVMSFGSPTPIEVAVSGPDLQVNKEIAEKIRLGLQQLPALRDLHYLQPLDYPTLDIELDREQLGLSGGTVKQVTDSVVAATSSSRYFAPLYWPDPKTGIGFQVQVEIPQDLMTSAEQIGLVLVQTPSDGGPGLRLRDVAKIKKGTMPGEYDRYNMRRLVSLTANIEGTDLGRVADQVTAVLQQTAPAASLPKGVQVHLRGQIEPYQQIFRDLALGLLMTGVAIFFLLWAYFQSYRLALISVACVPAVLVGVLVALVLTRTTLNLQSFMGAIMAVGVAVANAILLVTFADKARRAGASAQEAALSAGKQRLRPILMTSCAMLAGMLPMALGLGQGGQQVAGLARAVIGGLLFSTCATLGLLPGIFTLWAGTRTQSPSLDPDDPASLYYADS